METVQLMFDGEMQECTVTRDRNNEYLCEAPNGRFVKFAQDVNLEEAVATHNEANSEVPVVIPEVTYGDVITFDENGDEIK